MNTIDLIIQTYHANCYQIKDETDDRGYSLVTSRISSCDYYDIDLEDRYWVNDKLRKKLLFDVAEADFSLGIIDWLDYMILDYEMIDHIFGRERNEDYEDIRTAYRVTINTEEIENLFHLLYEFEHEHIFVQFVGYSEKTWNFLVILTTMLPRIKI